jgi:hypothetical protein
LRAKILFEQVDFVDLYGYQSILGIMPRKKSTKKKTLTKKQLDILYECWKSADTTKDRLALIEKNLPKVSSLAALSIMRKLAKTDSKWLKMATRKSNQKEKEKIEKRKMRERNKIEKEKKRKEREKRKKEREISIEQKSKLTLLREKLKNKYLEKVIDKIENRFFFCSDVHQFVNSISCIFRIFSNDHILSRCVQCDKCSRFNKHMALLEEVIKDGKREEAAQNKTKRTTRNKTSSGSKDKKKKSASAGKQRARKTKNSA